MLDVAVLNFKVFFAVSYYDSFHAVDALEFVHRHIVLDVEGVDIDEFNWCDNRLNHDLYR